MRKIIGIAAIVAVALFLGFGSGMAQAGSSVLPRPELANNPAAALISAGPHVLTDYELYHLIRGRQVIGTTEQGTVVTITFNADGTASTGYDSGTWSIKNGKIVLSWIPADLAWGIRVDGAGKYFSTRSNREVTVR